MLFRSLIFVADVSSSASTTLALNYLLWRSSLHSFFKMIKNAFPRGLLGQWNYSVWSYNGGYIIHLYISHYTFVQIHKTNNTKSDPYCKLETLGGNNVSM